MRSWERPRGSEGLARVAAGLAPGLALAGPGRWFMALLWIVTSATVVAALLALALTATVWPVAVLLLLPAWLVAAPMAVRSAAGPSSAPPRPGPMAGLVLLHWAPALVVLALLAPRWIIVDADTPASLPALAPGELAVCRVEARTEAPRRGELVVAGAPGERFLGRILGLPGERIEPEGEGWRLDGVPIARSERDLLLPLDDDASAGTRSLVYRKGGRYLSLWSRGPAEAMAGAAAGAEIAAGEVYVLALDHGAGRALDSRSRGGFPLDRVPRARCLLLWSPERLARLGRSVP